MIVSILTAVTLPTVHNYQEQWNYETDIERLLSDIRYVQQQSIITTVKHGIVFDVGDNSYYLIKDKNNPCILEKRKLKKVKLQQVDLPTYNGLSFSGPTLFYKSLGNLDHRNGGIKLELADEEKEIVFSSNAGEINLR